MAQKCSRKPENLENCENSEIKYKAGEKPTKRIAVTWKWNQSQIEVGKVNKL